jgi:hypothetical protein
MQGRILKLDVAEPMAGKGMSREGSSGGMDDRTETDWRRREPGQEKPRVETRREHPRTYQAPKSAGTLMAF